MKKICQCCFEIYRGKYPIDYCPKVKCNCDAELVEIDDLLVDIIIKFWELEVQTIGSCAGHLYEDNFSPYLRLFAHQFQDKDLAEISGANLDDLKELHHLFNGLNKNYNFEIGEIEFSDVNSGYQFTVRPSGEPIKTELTAQKKD